MQWSMDGARSGDPTLWLEAHQNTAFTAHNPQTQILGIIGLGNIGLYEAQNMIFRHLYLHVQYYCPEGTCMLRHEDLLS